MSFGAGTNPVAPRYRVTAHCNVRHFLVSVVQISNPRQILREATRASHDRVDSLYSAFDLSNRDGYAAFLKAQAFAFLPVERAISSSAEETASLADWARRVRAPALLADLAALGIHEPETGRWETGGDEAHVLGAVYVLEGSRLGGRVLAAQVAPSLPKSFLAPGDSGLWRSLGETLSIRLIKQASLDLAIESAIGVFGLFERGASRSLEGAAR